VVPAWLVMATRDASHAGSWYESSAQVLRTQLSEWLQQANDAGDTRPSDATGACRAVIAPHAGYSYSGPCAAHAYRHLNPTAVKRVFLLGPSHHHFTRRCCLTECTQYDTPLGSITVR
jgi:AmmeMemoRadiSam system protein B